MTTEYVILVDKDDREIGFEEKLKAHELGLLHRAFSVCIFNTEGKLLLQQRASHKYHTPLLWANTCCSHPRKGETILQAATRRLQEEMGIQTDLKPEFSFIYKAKFDNGLIEHEFDHVLVGYSNEKPNINHEEVNDYIWMSIDEIKEAFQNRRNDFTAWFQILIDRHEQKLREYESLS